MPGLSDKQVADLCASHEEKAARIVKVREELTREMGYVDSFKRQVEEYYAKVGFISKEELIPALWNLETGRHDCEGKAKALDEEWKQLKKEILEILEKLRPYEIKAEEGSKQPDE
jgi:hypothetical protein